MSDSSLPVQLGLWTNWSHGPVLGKTLTVSRTDGALIIAFVAFFVTITGSQLWRIICFFLHSAYSSPQPGDAIYNQRQAILRNSSSPISSLWEFTQVMIAWRKSTSLSFGKLLPVSLCAAFSAGALIVASGFSSRVAFGDEVLIDGDHCGIVSTNNAAMVDDILLRIQLYHAVTTERHAAYAQRCYMRDANEEGCNTLARKSLPITIDRSANCPFKDSLCITQNANILLDTGPLDSHWDLGVNSPPDLRFQYRRTFHCAPLTTTDYKSNITDARNRTYTRYTYGPWNIENPTFNCNCSYAVPIDVQRPNRKLIVEAASTGFKLNAINAYTTNGSFNDAISAFTPIAEFSGIDADLDLVFLSANTVTFVEKSEDIWYRANSPVKVIASVVGDGNTTMASTFWEADEPAWPMGCVTRHQFCNPSSSQKDPCTKLGSFDDALAHAQILFDPMSGVLNWFPGILDQSGSLSTLLFKQGPRTLASRFSLIKEDVQAGIAPDQWQVDVTSWFSHMLAALQLQMVTIASGPSRINSELKDFIDKPLTQEQRRLCQSQKIRSTDYISFSIFGLLFIFGFEQALSSSRSENLTKVGGLDFWAVMIGLWLAAIVSVLDGTVVSTVLPTIVHELDLGFDYVCAANAYFLTTAAFQPLFGQLADLWGRRWLFISTVAIFVLGSGLCAGASNAATFIAARAIQGVRAGGINMLMDLIVCDIVLCITPLTTRNVAVVSPTSEKLRHPSSIFPSLHSGGIAIQASTCVPISTLAEFMAEKMDLSEFLLGVTTADDHKCKAGDNGFKTRRLAMCKDFMAVAIREMLVSREQLHGVTNNASSELFLKGIMTELQKHVATVRTCA
ncbi:MFS-type efflux transporter MFS1 [Paramyrothecium foliicola]|nr:MFS-type efflux transporter MFS1 [Paramyrothecium foliicola]